jgi:hypothetical protein
MTVAVCFITPCALLFHVTSHAAVKDAVTLDVRKMLCHVHWPCPRTVRVQTPMLVVSLGAVAACGSRTDDAPSKDDATAEERVPVPVAVPVPVPVPILAEQGRDPVIEPVEEVNEAHDAQEAATNRPPKISAITMRIPKMVEAAPIRTLNGSARSFFVYLALPCPCKNVVDHACGCLEEGHSMKKTALDFLC